MEFGIDIFLILFTVAFVAGLVDTIAGGGGLLTIPALLYTGLPPAVALATNKLQSTFGSGTAAAYFIKKMVDINKMKLMILCTFMGAFAGGFALLQIDASILKEVIPILLVIIGFYFYSLPTLEHLTKKNVLPLWASVLHWL